MTYESKMFRSSFSNCYGSGVLKGVCIQMWHSRLVVQTVTQMGTYLSILFLHLQKKDQMKNIR